MSIASVNTTFDFNPIAGDRSVSFNYDGNSYLMPYLNFGGVSYVYLAELEKGDFITATNTIYFYDGASVTPVNCSSFNGFRLIKESFVVLGNIGAKVSGCIIGGVNNGK